MLSDERLLERQLWLLEFLQFVQIGPKLGFHQYIYLLRLVLNIHVLFLCSDLAKFEVLVCPILLQIFLVPYF